MEPEREPAPRPTKQHSLDPSDVPNPGLDADEAAAVDAALRRLQSKRRRALDQAFTRSLPPDAQPAYVRDFDADAATQRIEISSVSLDQVNFLAQKRANEDAQEAESAARLHAANMRAIDRQKTAAKQRIDAQFDRVKGEILRRRQENIVRRDDLKRRMRFAFTEASKSLTDALAKRKKFVNENYGVPVPARGLAGVTEEILRKQWVSSPQPITLWIRCLRAVRDKLRRGRYSVHATVYDRLGGSPLATSTLGKVPEWELCNKTGPRQHKGRMRGGDEELFFNQPLRLTFPPELKLAPAMCVVFEVVQLKGRQSAHDEVVAWGAFPVCDASFQYVHGKFKTALLYGEVDSGIDQYGQIESKISDDLDNFLCNLYFEVEHKARKRMVSDGSSGTTKIATENDELEIYAKEVLRVSFVKEETAPIVSSSSARRRGERAGAIADAGSSSTAVKRRRQQQQQQQQQQQLAPDGSSVPPNDVGTRNGGGAAARAELLLHEYRTSVHPRQAVRFLGARHPVEPMTLVWRNLKAEIGSYKIRSGRGAANLSLMALAFVVRGYAHFLGQLVFLQAMQVPILAFELTCVPAEWNDKSAVTTLWTDIWQHLVEFPICSLNPFGSVQLTYDTQQIDPYVELGVAAVGLGSVMACLLFCIWCAVLSRWTLGWFEDGFSVFMMSLCLATCLDPYVILVRDLVTKNWEEGDAFKLYHSFAYNEGAESAGRVGIGLVSFLYVVHGTFSFCLAYLYFFRLHRNGQVQDLLRRSEAVEAELILPEDDELSVDELEFICKHCAMLQRRRGYTKEAVIAEVAFINADCGPDSDEVENEIMHKVRIFEYPTASGMRAQRSLWRQFDVHADGRVIEVFDLVSEGGGNGREKQTNGARLDQIRGRNLGST